MVLHLGKTKRARSYHVFISLTLCYLAILSSARDEVSQQNVIHARSVVTTHVGSRVRRSQASCRTLLDSASGSQPAYPTLSLSTPASWTVFKTEPTFRPQSFEIAYETDNQSSLAPGYLFLDPSYKQRLHGLGPWGPQIYDHKGQLIWHGEKGLFTQDFHVCDYLGERGTHLCFHKRLEQDNWTYASRKYGLASGEKHVLDQTYSVVKTFTNDILGFGPNAHEFNEINNGTSFLQAVYVLKSKDLSFWGGQSQGWVKDGCFQEIDIQSNRPVFDWCWLDHLPLEQSTLYPISADSSKHDVSRQAGKGNSKSPWDFAHINSIDKTFERDYLISFRHCDQIVKIAGAENVHGVPRGTVLWQLGGKGNQFKADFTFTKQHHIRIVSMTASETTLSILNNDLAGDVRGVSDISSGQIIVVNNQTMEASLVHDYPQPDCVWTAGKGNLQILENQNVLIGWGFIPAVTEYDHNGTVLYHAQFTGGMVKDPKAKGHRKIETSYRTFKSPWIGKPHWKPKLLAYSRTCFKNNKSPLMAYVSWNGATEVVNWKFLTSSSRKGPWHFSGVFPKQGFETKVQLSHSPLRFWSSVPTFVSVVALDANGNALGSTSSQLFVPQKNMTAQCGSEDCTPEDFEYPLSLSMAKHCHSNRTVLDFSIVLFVVMVEMLSYLSNLTVLIFSGPHKSNTWILEPE